LGVKRLTDVELLFQHYCNFDSTGNLYVTDAVDLSNEVPAGRFWRIEASAINEVAERGKEPR
jgi:sugar lactone lactonase YvrE